MKTNLSTASSTIIRAVMGAALRIREAASSDVTIVLGMFALVDAQHGAEVPHRVRGSSARLRPEKSVHALLENPDAVILLAELDERVIGQVVVQMYEIPDEVPFVPRKYALVHDLVVTERMRRQGIGKKLMNAVEQWVLERGVDTIELTVYEFNEQAIRMYESMGYAPEYRRFRRKFTG